MEKKTYSASVKSVLKELKIDKKCCRNSYNYGLKLFEDDFTFIDRSAFKCPSCASHFLRGVFVGYGFVNPPEKGYHLEIKAPGKPEADEVAIFLSENGLDAKVSKRKNNGIVYFKDGDTIFGFLSFVGAQKYAFEFLDKIVEKQVRNDVNRRMNFESANMQKAATASAKQLEAIRYFSENGKYDLLSDKTAYTARLKEENPSLNLAELAALHEPPVTKSCVNHRLAKIIELYEQLTGKKD